MSYQNSKKYGSGVQLYKKANGDISYYITYKDEDNKLKRIKIGDKSGGITERFANNKRLEILHKIRLGEEIPLAKKKKQIVRFDDIANIYFNERKSLAKRKSIYYNHIKPKFGSINIEKIKKQDILDFREKLIKQQKANQTVNNIISLFSTIFNYNIKEKELKLINPCNGIRKLKTDNNRERYLTVNDIELLFQEIEHSTTLWLFVKLALQTGGRLETILHIQKKDLDLSSGTVTLKNLKVNKTYKGFIQTSLIEFYQIILLI